MIKISDATLSDIASRGLLTKGEKEQILTNQEKSEKWDEATTVKGYEEFLKNKEIRARLEKRIVELKKLLQNTRLEKDESMELQYWLRENTMALDGY